MINRKLADVLKKIADLLEIEGVQWKPQAYRKAAGIIENNPEDIKQVYSTRGKTGILEINGVGPSIADHIVEFLETGKIGKYENLVSETPASFSELLRIEGLGPKKLKILNKKLNVKSLEDLKQAIRSNHLANLQGFGRKTQQNLRESIATYEKGHDRMLIHRAYAISQEIIEHLKKSANPKQIIAVGSLRRMKETIGDIDILAVSDRPKSLMSAFVEMNNVERILNKGKTKSSIVTTEGIDVDLRVLPLNSYGSAMQYFTGSKQHNIQLRNLAMEKGYKLSEYGLFIKGDSSRDSKIVAGKTEKEIYSALGLHFIEPELREGRNEIRKAENGEIPRLVERPDIKGDLHMHTRSSDGTDSVLEMAKAAIKLGYDYIAITDHSQSQRIAGGLGKSALRAQWKEIDDASKKLNGKIRILKGAEVDILKDGSLDYPDSILKELDWVIASVHFRFKAKRTEMTNRIIKALQNPYVCALGHPTGRLIGKRKPYEADFKKIFKAAKDNSVVIEINSDPMRLDANDSLILQAKRHGLKFCVNTDAHSGRALENMRYGLGMARRGWLQKSDIINTLNKSTLKKHMKKPSNT